jgi:hypothetical protein
VETVTVDDRFAMHTDPDVVEFNFSRQASDRSRNLSDCDEIANVEYLGSSKQKNWSLLVTNFG